MKIFIVENIHQVFRWVNENKPKTYNRAEMRGVEDNATESEFRFVLRQHDWMFRLRGVEISSYFNWTRTPLTPDEEYFMLSLIK